MGKWEFYRKGYVRLRFWGENPERFLNLCAYHRIPVWNLISIDKAYEMNTTVEGFRRLSRICRKSRVKIKIRSARLYCPSFFTEIKRERLFFWAFFWDLASFSFFPDTSGTSM